MYILIEFCFQNVNSLFQITFIVKGNYFLFRGIQEAVTLVGARTYFIHTCLEFSSTQGQKYTQPRGFFIFLYYTTCIYSFVFSGSLCVYMLLFQFLNHCMAFFGFSYYLNFQALKVLRTADYAPYVVFIAAPRFNDHLLRKTKDMNVSQDYRQEPVLRSYFKDIHLITTS